MPRDEREVITKAKVQEKLCQDIAFSMRMGSFLLLPMCFFMLLISLIVSEVGVWIVFFVFLSLYLVFLIDLGRSLAQYRNGRFLFVKDTLQGLAPYERMVRYGHSSHPQSAIYFSRHGRVVSKEEIMQLFSVGDEFLLVVKDTPKQEVLFYYNTKFYRTEEWDG